jgi:hypothetical protein
LPIALITTSTSLELFSVRMEATFFTPAASLMEAPPNLKILIDVYVVV